MTGVIWCFQTVTLLFGENQRDIIFFSKKTLPRPDYQLVPAFNEKVQKAQKNQIVLNLQLCND